MNGSRLRQALSLSLVPVFALGLLGGAYGLHGCPRHQAVGHGGEGGGDAGAPSCICIGSCHAGAAAAHPVPPVADVPDAPWPLASEGRLQQAVPPHRTPAYFLPYPLGPPGA